MRSFVTGIGGFAGGHLAAALLAQDDEVAGYTLARRAYPQLEPFAGRVRLFPGDVRDGQGLAAAMGEFRPGVVYHLAAITHVGQSWGQRRETLEVNVLGTAAVLEVAGALEPRPVVLVVSSGQVYGAAARAARPLSEAVCPRPLSPYAASKRCAEVVALQAWRSEGVPAVIVRAFNYVGPWQGLGFVCSDFARQIAWAEAGLRPREVVVGDLAARRDFTDVRDVVEGFVLAATRGRAGRVYNLARGRAVAIGEILERLLALAQVPIQVRRDPERLRPAELPILVGDPSRARRELGWEPRIPLERTLEDILEFWRGQAAAEGAGGQADP